MRGHYFITGIFACVMLAGTINHSSAQQTKGPLDGKIFVVELYKEGKSKKWSDDDLSFRFGKFKSSLFTDWTFKSSSYSVTYVDSTSSTTKAYTWAAETKNDDGERMMWSGTIKGEDIEGTVEHLNKKGDTKNSYTFNGSLKKKPGQK
jgi:hypothetical protein